MIFQDPLLLPGILIIFFILALLVIAVINMSYLRNLRDYKKINLYPRISALVPARNEEGKIGACVNSLLAQDYPDFQVIVLNDNSTDHTGEILDAIALNDSRLKVINGRLLPAGWLGKHWACHQLYMEADGELLIFTDSDTVHSPDTLRCTAAAIQNENADMISIIPRHNLRTWAEKLIMPFFALGVFAIIPLPSSLRPKRFKVLSSSGKLMAFRRKSYEICGGFESIRQNVMDDLELPQRVISCGMRYRLLNGTDNVSCRMYHSFKEVHEGLTKNMFASYGYNIALITFTWLWISFAFWEPVLVITAYRIPDYPPTLSIGLAAISIIATLLLWGIYYKHFKFPLYMIFFYPVSVALMAAISVSSMVLTLSGHAVWKDRKMPTRKMY